MRSSTTLQHESAWKSWTSWCSGQQVNPLSPTVADLVNFLAKAHSNGKSYSTLNTYRSALSSALPRIEGHVAGQHPLIVRLMREYLIQHPRNRDTQKHGKFQLF